ncbi:hypothetical protein BS47DRAFT_1339767 [Hydnum rufescens UP504]|uniref:Uncharacterized protein n=1 Tax=Hydnum rufescens UP504 TaxID=1448309 RepID=A0A9P6E039_9AGAM|nr:hypothetical protein BS47DRAFT_1339767 [Hydnum rufescens UP504]
MRVWKGTDASRWQWIPTAARPTRTRLVGMEKADIERVICPLAAIRGAILYGVTSSHPGHGKTMGQYCKGDMGYGAHRCLQSLCRNPPKCTIEYTGCADHVKTVK